MSSCPDQNVNSVFGMEEGLDWIRFTGFQEWESRAERGVDRLMNSMMTSDHRPLLEGLYESWRHCPSRWREWLSLSFDSMKPAAVVALEIVSGASWPHLWNLVCYPRGCFEIKSEADLHHLTLTHHLNPWPFISLPHTHTLPSTLSQATSPRAFDGMEKCPISVLIQHSCLDSTPGAILSDQDQSDDNRTLTPPCRIDRSSFEWKDI